MIDKLMSNSRTTEVDAVSMRIIGAYKKTTLNTDTYLSGVMLSVEEKSLLLTQAINRMKAESDLEEKDEIRDNAFRSLYFLVNGLTHHPDPAISEAAAKVDAVLEHYGLSVIQQNYSTESSLISSMLDDLGKPNLQDSIAALSGCAELIAALKTAEDNFENARILYEEEKAGEGTLSNATAIKKEVVLKINDQLVVYLRAMEQVNDTTYGAFARTVAQIIADNNEVVKKRRKKPEAEPAA
ncbi:MAG TPA: DUF6261 family protein [Draconibacterium sp.]|nr:DUF6261 family protein [Draconibacterium sp.]